MRRIRPEGVTLMELVVALVVLAIIGGLVTYFVLPVRQAIDVTVRAELTDTASNALQRIAREVRLALPNSVRVAPGGVGPYLEYLPVVAAGRYRSDSGGPAGGLVCPDTAPLTGLAADQLSFNLPDTCFKSLGPVHNGDQITTNDFVVLNNYGQGFPGQDAYENAATNVRGIDATSVESTPQRQRIAIEGGSFSAGLHDSPGKRFFVVQGNGGDLLPVSFECNNGLLLRWTGYPRAQNQPTSFASGTSSVLASGVATCTFSYKPNTAPQAGLLTLQLTLQKARADGSMETVTLYHSVHVMNVP